MSDSDFIWRFTPSRTDPQLLENIFVQRHGLLDDILEKAAESVTTGNRHHLLLVGPRGIGKTHLISLLHHRIVQDESLAPRVRIAWLLEDETVTSFTQLLKRTYELLAEQHPDEFPLEWLRNLLGRPTEQIQRELETRLVAAFADKTLLLLIENLDLIFEGLGATGQKQWRSFLQEHPLACIVASTQRLSDPIRKRTEPFFGFFESIHLKPLKVQDATDLLERIAKTRQQQDLVAFLNTPDGRSRVRALHHLAGGNHRIYIVLSGFITRESLDQLVQPFEKMADELTPYYQERMRWLSPQKRQIVEYLCSQDSPVMPKEIAHNLMAAENTISSQLKKLLEYGYVLRNPRGRESLYELAEPLMRLASEVKDKRRKPLRMLVDFLRVWYRPDQLPAMLDTARSESLRSHLKAAIELSRTTPDPRLTLLEVEIEECKTEDRRAELLLALEERAHVDGSAMCWFELAYCLGAAGRFVDAIKYYDKGLSIDSRNAFAWFRKGAMLVKCHRWRDSAKCFDMVLDIDPMHKAAKRARGLAIKLMNLDDRVIPNAESSLCKAESSLSKSVHRLETSIDDLLHAIIDCPISGSSTEPRHTLKTLIEDFNAKGSLTLLGDGLVRSLKKINADMLSEKALALWRDLWLELGSPHIELELPLRIFRVGIEYLIKHDDRVLLDLITTERRILQQALGLEPADSEAL